MALISRFMSPDWAANDDLAAADLSAEFNTIHNALKDGTVDINVNEITGNGNMSVTGAVTLSGSVNIGADANSIHTITGNTTFQQTVTIDVLVVNNVAELTATNIAATLVNTTTLTVNSVNVEAALVPLGSIIPHYDFNAALVPSNVCWAYCDGSAVTIAGNSYTTPDMSGRYLVGFGGATDGAGDIDTATWATDVVGAALHQVDLSHTHTGPSHTHTFAHTHEHTHTHTSGSLVALVAINDSTGTVSDGISVKRASTTAWDATVTDNAGGSVTAGDSYNNGAEIQGSTGAADDATTDSQSTSTTGASGTGNTGSGGSSTQSIQPRSIRVRFIMRIA